jgi:hypothetical protein
MTTPRTHSLVSLAVALTLTLGACASAPSRTALDRPVAPEGLPLAIRFNNEAGDYVHVYLVGARRQWLLGRVEAGARSSLRIPEAALAANEGWMRLAVLEGQRVTMHAADDPRAAITSAQPATGVLSRSWTFSARLGNGQLTEIPIRSAAHAELPRR